MFHQCFAEISRPISVKALQEVDFHNTGGFRRARDENDERVGMNAFQTESFRSKLMFVL